MIGKKKMIDGILWFSPEYYSDGCSFGTIFKDDDAFKNNPSDVCYIPESSFIDAPSIETEGETYYLVDGYSRTDLENLIGDNKDEDGNEIDVADFFCELTWACPETYLNEITY